jgi:hypothetical protein
MLRKKNKNRNKGVHSLLVLSPEGKPLIKSIQFNVVIFFLLIAAAVCGVVALFLPSDVFRARDDDGFKKLHLFEQDRLLQDRVNAISQVVENCEEQIGMLDRKKERVIALMGSGKKVNKAPRKPGRSYVARLQNDPEKLLGEITRWEVIFTEFMAGMETGNLFDTLPVCRPVETSAACTRPFGKVHDPFTGRMKWHYGIDYSAPVGTWVMATASGQVVRVGYSSGWGRRVLIRHARGITTKYAHLGTVKVKRGQKVDRGEVIGTVGSSGLATGPHVHYELWYHNRPVDPERFYFPFSDASRVER